MDMGLSYFCPESREPDLFEIYFGNGYGVELFLPLRIFFPWIYDIIRELCRNCVTNHRVGVNMHRGHVIFYSPSRVFLNVCVSNCHKPYDL